MDAVNTAEDVLKLLERTRARMGMSKAELARRGRLPPETVRRLLTSSGANPHFSMVAELLKPAGLGLFVGMLDEPAESAPADPESVQAWLAHLGAPLYGSTAVKASDVPRPELVVAEALPLARREAAVARALPVALYRSRKRLDFNLLRRLSRERGQGRALGFFLELTADLAGDRSLAHEARPLARGARRRARASQFFKLRSATERRLAELKTPAVARRWGFRMNMSDDSFASMFRKATRVSA
jgi:transcriptional regulator with XRE-family HTH domain